MGAGGAFDPFSPPAAVVPRDDRSRAGRSADAPIALDAVAVPTLTRPAPGPVKLTDGELLDRAGKRIGWAALSLRAAAGDLTNAGQSGAQAVELADALHALAQDLAGRLSAIRR